MLITDRGYPVALLTGPVTADLQKVLPRRFTRESAAQLKQGADSTAAVSAMRDDR